MSDLSSRLRELVRKPGGPPLLRNRSRATDGAGLREAAAASLGGRCPIDSAGGFVIVDRTFGPSTFHGADAVGEWSARAAICSSAGSLLTRPRRDADAIESGRESESADALLFVDLETTGLAGGAGTVAFLIGLGWFEDGAFCTRQFLLTDLSTEQSLLREVATDLIAAGTLVSFNGKSFDIPILETRYLFHRLDVPFSGKAHLDLLHPARRLWRSPEGCALTFLERDLFAVERRHDVAGYEIPARYFDFIRSGNPAPLSAVVEHNRLDLMSLAGLTMRAFQLVEQGAASTRDGRECLGLGRLYERAGVRSRARECYDRASRQAGWEYRDTRVEALKRLARLLRRERRHHEAASVWEELLGASERPSPTEREALEALAVHHEHRSRDLQRARHYTQQVLAGDRRTAARILGARHRLDRLDRKLARGGLLA